jgi:dolichyl-phosphate-mannose--protein O-mannosyl transferase
VTDELLNSWILLPAMVAALSGLAAHARGRSGWAVGLAVVGFFVVLVVAFLVVLAGLIFHPAIGPNTLTLSVWSPVLLYWLIAIAIARTLDNKPEG